MPNENKRQLVHTSLFLLAFLLKYLSRFEAAAVVFLLFFLTVFILPRLKMRSHFYRSSIERHYSQGAILYFLVLLVLILIFPLYIVAVSWAVMALGDGSATLIGRHFKARELPWNRSKTYVGSLAFIVFGSFGALLLLLWNMPETALLMALSISIKTSVVAAVVESLPWRINDNISVPITSALVLYFILS